jgi:hypothetical protein
MTRRSLATLSLAVTLTALAACSPKPVVTTSDAITIIPDRYLEAFREPTGDWMNVGDVRMDYNDPRKLEIMDTHKTGVIVNGYGGKTSDLVTKAEFGDITFHTEFMVSRGSNSGVYFMGRYELQILDSFGKDQPGEHDNGAIYQRWDPKRGKGNEGYEGHPPRSNPSKHPGQWQTFDVIFRAPRFDNAGKKIANAKFIAVRLNKVLIHENVEVTGPTRGGWPDEAPTGPLRLQGDHGPVAFRNMTVTPFK